MTPTGTTTVSGAKIQKRAEARAPVKHSGILHYKGTQIPVVLQDLSRGGVRVGLNASRAGMVIDGSAILEVPGAMRLPLNVRWQKNSVFGATFDVAPARKATFLQQIDRLIKRAGR